jgi:membrane fusion protein (multidrug efflux system)
MAIVNETSSTVQLRAPNSLIRTHGSKDAEAPGKKPANKLLMIVVALAVFIALGIGAFIWWLWLSSHEQTDDAYIAGHNHAISARINDTVQAVLVNDNDHVQAGQLLVELDPRDFQDKVDQARAALQVSKRQAESSKVSVRYASKSADAAAITAKGAIAKAHASLASARAAVQEAQAAIPVAEAQAAEVGAQWTKADLDRKRYVYLEKRGAVTTEEKDTAVKEYQVYKDRKLASEKQVEEARSRLLQAQHNASSFEGQLQEAYGQLEQAHSADIQTEVNQHQVVVATSSVQESQTRLHDALLQRSYCSIRSPITGRVGKKTVEAGQRVEPGEPLMTVVSDYMWVIANFKETQLERMHAGQYAELHIDSFPHHKFVGVIDSLSPGSGNNFALLPSDNATGNFTKIVQRLPVKVVFTRDSLKGFENSIVPGMSVVVTVDLKSKGGENVLRQDRQRDTDVKALTKEPDSGAGKTDHGAHGPKDADSMPVNESDQNNTERNELDTENKSYRKLQNGSSMQITNKLHNISRQDAGNPVP